MGICKLPVLEMYWATPTRQATITTLVPTHAEFARFCVDLHMVDTSVYTATEQTAMNISDPFWKLGEGEDRIDNTISKLFARHRVCATDLTLDEFGVPFKGRHRARQHNKQKPNPYHFRGFSLNEARTGYSMGLYMYQGQSEKLPKGIIASANPAFKLFGGIPELHNRGCTLWADNWFSGMGIIDVCHSFGVRYAGVTKTNRIGGAFNKDTATASKDWKRGHYRAQTSTNVATTPVWCYQWQDKKVVSILSTFPCPAGIINRKTLHGASKRYELCSFPCPAVIGAYNFGKVGTDRMDQTVAYYYKNRRFRWHVKIMVHLFYISMQNAHITYRELAGKTKRQLPFLKFIQEVCTELQPPPPKLHAKYGHVHTPTIVKNLPQGKKGWKDMRRHCKECTKRTTMYCKECEVYLHCDVLNGETSCWSDWHEAIMH